VEKDIQAALDYFETQGVQFWILDLRNNPGGYVETLRRSLAASSKTANRSPINVEINNKARGDQHRSQPLLHPQHRSPS
jgi:C-terminal processing protease CtpA/Prc